MLNLIDTPGHVDFTYEVSRSLAACEGAVLLVDAAQGIEAQTLANLYLALENDLHDHPGAQQDRPAGRPAGEVRRRARAASSAATRATCCGSAAKTGEGVAELLDRGRRAGPAARSATPDAPARAMIFDSVYDTYRGVVTYVRVIDGQLSPRERILMMSTGADARDCSRSASSRPSPMPTDGLGVGEVGYLITGVKDVRQSRVGDTVTSAAQPAPPSRSAATSTPADGLLRPLPDRRLATTRSCATRSTSCSSTTPRWSTSRRPRPRSASGSAAASSACCTWRSSASGSSASSTST